MSVRIKGIYLFLAALFFVSWQTGHADPQDTIDHRVKIMQTIREQSEILGLIAQNKAPADHMVAHAQVLALNAAAAKSAFQPNVPGGRAKAEVWTQWQDFSKKMDLLNAAANELVKSTKSEGANNLGPKLAGLGCKGCHDTYRGPKR